MCEKDSECIKEENERINECFISLTMILESLTKLAKFYHRRFKEENNIE